MPVQAFISISFEAADGAAAQAVVDALTLPAGANVAASVTEQVVQGTVDESGVIQAPAAPEPAP